MSRLVKLRECIKSKLPAIYPDNVGSSIAIWRHSRCEDNALALPDGCRSRSSRAATVLPFLPNTTKAIAIAPKPAQTANQY